MVAELTDPNLLVTFLHDNTTLIKDSVTAGAKSGVSSRQLASILETVQGDLEDVCVKLNDLDLTILSFLGIAKLSKLFSHILFLIAEIEITI